MEAPAQIRGFIGRHRRVGASRVARQDTVSKVLFSLAPRRFVRKNPETWRYRVGYRLVERICLKCGYKIEPGKGLWCPFGPVFFVCAGRLGIMVFRTQLL